MLKVLSCYVVTVLLCVFPVYGEDTHIKETHKEESKRHGNVSSKLFKAEQWDKLEKLLDEAREQKKRNSFGGSLLFDYYSGCSVDYEHKRKTPDAKWLEYKKKLEKWAEAKPDSISALCVQIDFWTSYAWKSRRGKDAGKGLDDERIDKAEEIYNKVKKQYGEKLIPCPHFYKVVMTLALEKSWDNERTYSELVKPVIKNWPLYYSVYRGYSHRLSPYWHGESWGDSYKFYNSLKEEIGGEFGKEVSAYSIFLEYGRSLDKFRYDLVDEDEMLEGLLYHVRRNPNDVDLLKRVITFSIRYDFETTHKLLKDLRKLTPSTFKQFEEQDSYGTAIKAMMATPKKSIELDYYIRPASTEYIRDIHYAATQDNVDHLVYSQGWKALVVARISDCKILAIEKYKRSEPIYFGKLALSKSGDHIFVEVRKKGKRLFRIYSFKENQLELVKNVPSPMGFSESVEFVENDETLLIAGEEKGSRYKKSLYFRWKWKTEKPQLIAKSVRNKRTRMVVLEDQKRAICGGGSGLFYYNYTEEKPEIHKVDLKVGGISPTYYDLHYAKEIGALVVLTKEDNSLALFDSKTFELKASRKLNNYPSKTYLLNGYKFGDNEYTLCVSGDVGQISLFHYNSKKKEPISYESTWVNGHHHSRYLSVVEKEGEAPRIVQFYDEMLLGSYIQKKKEAD